MWASHSGPQPFDHTRRPFLSESCAGSGSRNERTARERAGSPSPPTRRESCLPACPRLSPSRHTFSLALAAAHSHPVHLAHTPLSTRTRSPSPSHACGSQPLPRTPSRATTRAPGAPASLRRSPGLAAAPARGSGVRNPSPGPRPASVRRERGRNPSRRAGRSARWGREARGAAARGGEGALAHSRPRTRPYKLSHRDTRGALPPPAAAPPPATALRGRKRARQRERFVRAPPPGPGLCPEEAAAPSPRLRLCPRAGRAGRGGGSQAEGEGGGGWRAGGGRGGGAEEEERRRQRRRRGAPGTGPGEPRALGEETDDEQALHREPEPRRHCRRPPAALRGQETTPGGTGPAQVWLRLRGLPRPELGHPRHRDPLG